MHFVQNFHLFQDAFSRPPPPPLNSPLISSDVL